MTAFQKDNDLKNQLEALGYATANGALQMPAGDVSGHTALVGGTLNAQTSLAGVGNGADTTMDVLFSKALQANLLASDGDSVVVEAFGSFGATANNKRVQLKFGATVVADSAVITDNGKAWRVRARITRQAAGKQVADGLVVHDATNVQTVSGPTEDETGAITVEVLGGSTTTGAANDVLCNDFRVRIEPAA